MVHPGDISGHMEVVGSDGAHVGTVDHVEDDRINLARATGATHQHYHVPLELVSRIDTSVHLRITGAQALAEATGAEPAKR